MANNEYVNKVLFGNTTVMDISDTTAEQGDVIEGQVFYTKSGAPAIGILGDATTSTHGLMSVEDKVKLDNINEIQIDKTIDTPAAIMSFSDGADNLPMALTVGIEPVQDLHGYANPWPAGGGANILPMPITSGSYANAVTVTVNDDLSFYITKTSDSGWTSFQLANGLLLTAGDYVIIESDDGSANATVVVEKASDSSAITNTRYNSRQTFNLAEDTTVNIRFSRSAVASNVLTKLMLFKGTTQTADDYVPYSNICPISGWTGANVTRTGKNLFDKTQNTLVAGNGYKYYLDSSGNHDLKCNSTSTATTVAIPCEPNRTYTAQITSAWNIFRFCYCKDMDFATKIAGGNTITTYGFQSTSATGNKSLTLTTGDGAKYLIVQSDSTAFSTDKELLMISNGDSAQEYEQFMGYDVYPITFPSSAGTVYGGELTVNKDGTGELVVDTVYDDIPNCDRVGNSSLGTGKYATFSYNEKNLFVDNATATIVFDNMNSCAFNDRGDAWSGYINSANIIGCFVPSDYTVEMVDEKLNGGHFVAKLATPTTYPLTAEQVKTLLGVNNIWADTSNINSVTYSKPTSGLINTYDKVKLNSLATVSLTGNYNDLLNKPDLSSYLTSVPTMTGATSSAAGATGLVPAPTSADVDKFLAGDGTYKSGGLPMVILSYGNSTWAEFEAAYNNNVIVYTRASSNSNPATGSQTRMAFMAYVNNATTPTEVEFQYYRSMSSHSATAMGDQVFVYKLTKTGGWSVTSRDASIKEIKIDSSSSGTVSWSSNVVTLQSGLPKVTASDNGKILKVVNGAWAAVSPE